mgnify:FL=1|jgi:hypothetical protein
MVTMENGDDVERCFGARSMVIWALSRGECQDGGGKKAAGGVEGQSLSDKPETGARMTGAARDVASGADGDRVEDFLAGWLATLARLCCRWLRFPYIANTASQQ